MENIVMSEVPTNPAPAQAPTLEAQLVNTPVTDENVALNVLVAFCGLANKRGAFNLQESAKIWEAIQKFSQPPK
jgi:hypothetical protein